MTAELAIIGGGPAGISAAIEAARLGITALVIEKSRVGGAVWCARRIENFPPFSSRSGKELGTMFEIRFAGAGVKLIEGEVTGISFGIRGGFELATATGEILKADVVVLSTGQVNHLPPELFSCASNLAFPGDMVPSEGDDIVVYGGGDAAFDQALLFRDGGCRVRLFCRSAPRSKMSLVREAGLRGVHVNQGFTLESARTSGAATEACFIGVRGEKRIVRCARVLAALGKVVPDMDICGRPLPDLLKDGVGERGELKAPGIFAAGDLRRGRMRNVAVAVADGIMSANAALSWLKGERDVSMGDR